MRRLALAVLYLIYRTFVAFDIYRGSEGRELHANAIEAFSAKGLGRPVSASSQVYSR